VARAVGSGREDAGQKNLYRNIEIQMQIQRDQRSAFVSVGRFKALGLRRPKGLYKVVRRPTRLDARASVSSFGS